MNIARLQLRAAIFVFLLLTFNTAQAQSSPVLQGMVTDSSTGQPVSGVSVAFCPSYQNCGSSLPLTVTDTNGACSLTAAQLGSQTQVLRPSPAGGVAVRLMDRTRFQNMEPAAMDKKIQVIDGDITKPNLKRGSISDGFPPPVE
jgi:hypothetical protein